MDKNLKLAGKLFLGATVAYAGLKIYKQGWDYIGNAIVDHIDEGDDTDKFEEEVTEELELTK